MRHVHLSMGLAILLWGTTATLGHDFFGFAQCDPCGPMSPPCDPCGGKTGLFTPWTFGGWIDVGVYTNSHGFNNNGPVSTDSRRRTDVVMNQLYLSAEKEMDTRRGFDWGACADFVYGAHAGSMQTYDGSFDANWGLNRHGYAMSAYKLYGTLGYRDLSVKVGKFVTTIGWEASASKDSFFYSHSYCYWIEPATHMGALATYDLTNRLSLNAGWVTGMDSSFANPYGNQGVLTGFEYALTDNATVHYWLSTGRQFDYDAQDYFIQSICLEWAVTNRFTYVLQYNLRNDNYDAGNRESAYGINNHFLYKLNDRWGVGTRFEWLRNNSGLFTNDNGVHLLGDFYQVTLGLNWNPKKNVSIRPEVRYDWCKKVTPFGNSTSFGGFPTTGTRSHQVSGGCGVVVSF